MGMASREAWKIIEEKRKYWYKTLSTDAMWSVLGQSINIFDWLSFFSDYTLSDTLFSSLVSMLLLDIPPIDIVPWNVNFVVELPLPEEFIRGVLIKLRKITFDEVVDIQLPEFSDIIKPGLYDIDKFLETFLKIEFARPIIETRPRKAIYGVTRYDESYYDPTAVREFFRSTLYTFMKKDITLEEARNKIEATAKVLSIHEELARTIFNRLSAITSIKDRALTWDYGWWDRSYWSEEGSEGLIEFRNYELQSVKMPYEDLIDYQACGFWDDAIWDYFCWCDEIHPFRVEEPNLPMLAEAVWVNFRNRIISTYLAVANYQTLEERSEWTKSLRVDTYALPMSMRMHLERIVESIVRMYEPAIDPCRLRSYKSAALQIFGELTAMHRWGTEMYKAMSEEELREWWLEKWSRDGLDRGVLEAIYRSIRPRIDTFIDRRFRERMRFLRRKLRRMG